MTPTTRDVLQIEYIVKGPIEAVRPQVRAARRIDQLARDADPGACLAYAPFQQ